VPASSIREHKATAGFPERSLADESLGTENALFLRTTGRPKGIVGRCRTAPSNELPIFACLQKLWHVYRDGDLSSRPRRSIHAAPQAAVNLTSRQAARRYHGTLDANLSAARETQR